MLVISARLLRQWAPLSSFVSISRYSSDDNFLGKQSEGNVSQLSLKIFSLHFHRDAEFDKCVERDSINAITTLCSTVYNI